MEELYSKCGSRPCPRRAAILNTIDGISEKSMDQQKIFGAMEELYSKCGSRPCPRRAAILNTIDGISEKSMDQQKIFGTNRA
jgi:ribosomal protein L20A (L18A)